MGVASIRVLGGSEVERDGEVHAVAAAKERLVLTALALAAPRLVAVDELHQLLWEEPPATASKTVQNYVSRLRRAVGGDVLHHRGGGYQLDVDPEVVDARRFERLVRAARRLLEDGDAGAALTDLDGAEKLWRGPIACDGGTTSAAAITSRFAELRTSHRELHAEAGLRAGTDVVPELEAAVHDDPTRERFWELLVLALRRDGRTADGLRAYQRARDALAEIGLAPGTGLREAERSLLVAEDADDGEAPRAPLPAAFDRDDRYPLVGRDREVDVLDRARRDTCAGRPRAVAVIGAAGNGKSRLLAQLAAAAHAEGALVVLGAADDIDVTSYRLVSEPVLAAAPEQHRRRLEQLLSRAGGADDGSWRRQLATACRDALEAAAAGAPVVVVLEDLHWADTSSLRLLQAVVSAVRGRVLLACSLRPEGLAQPSLEAFVAALHRQAHADVVDVGPLPRDAIERLLALTHGHHASADAVERLANATGGNAFLVTEVLREGFDARGGVPLPRAVRDVVAARLSTMGVDDRRALLAAAVAGDEVDAQIVAATTGLDLATVCTMLDDAARAGILAEGRAATAYRFVHDLTRQAVYDATPRLQRSEMHVAAAHHVRDREGPAAVVAHHLLAAGDVADGVEALTWASRAAADAAARRGFDEAARWLHRALERERTLPGDRSRRARLLYEHGVYLNAAGHTDPGRAVLAEAAELAEDARLLAEIGIAYSGGSGSYIDPNDDRGREMLARAEADLPETDLDLRCRVRFAQILWQIFDPDPGPRLALAEDLLRSAEASGDARLQGLALGGMQNAARGICSADELRRLAEEEWCTAGAVATGMEAVTVRLRLWHARIVVGDVAAARAAAREMRALWQATGSDTAAWYAHLLHGFHHYMDGDLDAASASADAAARTPVSLGIGAEGISAPSAERSPRSGATRTGRSPTPRSRCTPHRRSRRCSGSTSPSRRAGGGIRASLAPPSTGGCAMSGTSRSPCGRWPSSRRLAGRGTSHRRRRWRCCTTRSTGSGEAGSRPSRHCPGDGRR